MSEEKGGELRGKEENRRGKGTEIRGIYES